MMFAKMKMGHKILAGYAVAVAILLTLSAIAWSGSSALNDALHDLADAKVPSTEALSVLNEAQTAVARGVAQLLLRRADAEMREGARQNVRAAWERFDASVKAYEAVPHGEAALRLWAETKSAMGDWRTKVERTLSLLSQRDQVIASGKRADDPQVLALDDEAWQAFRISRAAFAPAERKLDELTEQTSKDADASKAGGAAAGARAITAIFVAAVAGTLLLLALGVFLARKVGGTVTALVAEAGKLRTAVAAGQLAVRGDVGRVDSEFRPIIEGVNETMDAFQKPLQVTAEYVTRISNGDLPAPIADRYEGDFNAIKEALNRCIGSLSGLVTEMNRMSVEHEKGDIDVVVDASRFQGAYRAMAEGLNGMVGAHIAVKKKAMGVFHEFGRGNFDATMENLPGKKRFINDTIEQVRKGLKELIAEMRRMSSEHDRGEIDVVIDAGRFQGDWRTVAEGVNSMVAGHIAVKKKALACVAEFGRGNFEAPLERFPGKKVFINETIEQVRANLKALIGDADTLVQAAVAGHLSTRADATKHAGDFRKIVEGVNRTLDAVIAPMTEAAAVLDKLAQRDLRARVQGSYQGDHARIKESLNATASSLEEALSQVSSAVDQVSSAATQIASSSQAVAAGASEQASSLEETSSSIESVAAITSQATAHAQQANTLAQTAKAAATEGSVAMDQMQGAMGKIKASAESTSQIIKDINDIAFQTNLLALNAAVEAARAGEAGRGFAVVAEEVRSLALRAKEAATKTEELIRQSVKEAGEGEVTSKQVSQKLFEIVGGVSKVSDIVSEIAAAAREQAAGIDQVNKAVAEMDKVTQQNAASAEESSSAASELSAQAEELAAMVTAFQVSRKSEALGRPQARAPKAAQAALPPATRNWKPAHANGRAANVNGHAARLFPMDEAAELKEF